MQLPTHLFSLPTSILLLLFSSIQDVRSQEHPSPTDLSPEYKYYPEHAHILRRGLEIQRKLQWQTPVGVKKMSGDPGEKFWLDYWVFDERVQLLTNGTGYGELEGALRVHYGVDAEIYGPQELQPRGLTRRDFECPSGSTACTSINRPNSCCASGTTCQLIPNSGSGDVGCCPSGQSCGNTLGDCREGSTSCDSDGGGCCLPGYACFEQGCVQTATTTVLVGPSTAAPSTVNFGGVSTTTVTSITTITRSSEEPEVVTTTLVLVDTVTESLQDPGTTTETTRSTVTTTDCPAQYRTCPESLGGGCCHTDRACATGSRCPASSTSSGLQPPDRPTSDTTTVSETTNGFQSDTSLPPGACPTGFYACKAFHQGGCCQTDRDCDTTSCPPLGTTTVVDTGDVTVVAPTGVAGANTPSGTCRSGWNSCPASLSGGCCPTGYGCEVATCTAESTEVAGSVGKIQPESSGAERRRGREVDVLVMSVVGVISSLVLGAGVLL